MAVTVHPLESERASLLVDVADVLRRLAIDVLAVTPQGAPPRSRISVGTPVEACCGSVTVILRRVVPTAQVALGGAAGSQPNGCEPFLWGVDWTLDVNRECPPNLGSIYNILPSPAAEREADTLMMLDVMSIVEQFASLVQQEVSRRVRRRGGVPVPGCVAYLPSGVVPYTEGDCSGWRFDFRLGLSF